MNRYTLIIYIGILCSLISCSHHTNQTPIVHHKEPQTISYQELVKAKNGLLYKKNTKVPYTGLLVSRFPSGKIQSKGVIRNGKMVDEYTEYFEGGQIKIKGEYRNGVQEGTWITNHSTGAVALKGQFINGLLQGTWYVYNQNGMLAKKMVYKDGLLIKTIQYRVHQSTKPLKNENSRT